MTGGPRGPDAGSTLVLGVGNILWGDDGVGVRLLDGLDGPWECFDGGVGGLGLLTVMEGHERVVILDAIDAGLAPGSVFETDSDRVELHRRLGCHQIDVADLLRWVREAGLVCKIHLIGVQPGRLAPGEGLSPDLASRLDEIRRDVRRRIDAIVERSAARGTGAGARLEIDRNKENGS